MPTPSAEYPARVREWEGLCAPQRSSVALTVVAVVASVLLALVVWLGHWPRLALLAVAGFGLAFAPATDANSSTNSTSPTPAWPRLPRS